MDSRDKTMRTVGGNRPARAADAYAGALIGTVTVSAAAFV